MMTCFADENNFICTFEDGDSCPMYDSLTLVKMSENWIKVDGSSASMKDNTLNRGIDNESCVF